MSKVSVAYARRDLTMVASVKEAAAFAAARKTEEVCNSVLTGTTVIFFSLLYSISVLGYRWRRRKTCSRRGLDPADLGLTKFHNLRMRVRRESLGPLLDGHLQQVL